MTSVERGQGHHELIKLCILNNLEPRAPFNASQDSHNRGGCPPQTFYLYFLGISPVLSRTWNTSWQLDDQTYRPARILIENSPDILNHFLSHSYRPTFTPVILYVLDIYYYKHLDAF